MSLSFFVVWIGPRSVLNVCYSYIHENKPINASHRSHPFSCQYIFSRVERNQADKCSFSTAQPWNGDNRVWITHPFDYESIALTAHNWQKWKRVFLTYPCRKICRDEAVGLKSCKYTWKITIFVKMWNLGQYRENLIFCQYLLNWSSNLKILLHMCDTYNCDYLKHSTFRFNLIDFQLNKDFPS